MLAAVRDVAIALLALESVVIGVLLALVLLQLRKLVRLLRDEIAPILDSAGDTATAVHGTVDFVSQTVVDPLVKIHSYSTGVRQVLRSFFLVGRKIKGHDSSGAGHEVQGNP